jgi:hypothetical protein
MKKIIIPRKDHEVYFIAMPDDLNKRHLRSFVSEQLEKMHPGYSPTTVFDLQHLVFNGVDWIMVTVMDAETMAEYRIIHNKTAFYTNTSILVSQKDFASSGINNIDDERIGFDPEVNIPISIPIEIERKNSSCDLNKELKSIPLRQSVFGRKMPQKRLAAMTTCFIGMVFILSIFIIAAKGTHEIPAASINYELDEEIKYLPSAIEMLTNIADSVLTAEGLIKRWRYYEDSEPFMEMQLQRIDASTAYNIFDQYEYAYLQDIKNVSYDNGKPVITAYLNAERAKYLIMEAGLFPKQSLIISAFTELASLLQQQEVIIASEELPSENSGNRNYTITYTAKDKSLQRSLKVLSEVCDRYLLRIKRMDISINENNNLFSIICTLSQGEAFNSNSSNSEESFEKIPAAFGYRENTYNAVYKREEKIKPTEKLSIVGSIRDGSGEMFFYRDNNTGEIQIRGEDEK